MLIVSNYHYIREDFSSKHPSIFGVTPQEFRRQLKELAKQGSFISQEDLLKGKGNKENNFLVTFDDGLREQYDLAKPVLDELGIPFVFFINTENFQEKKVSLVHKIHLLRSEIAPEELLQQLKNKNEQKLTSAEKQRAILHYNYDTEQTAILKYFLNFKMSLAQQEKFISPLFQQHFVETKVAAELYFSEEMLQELNHRDNLASHSHSHVPLGLLAEDEVKKELQSTQDFFRTKFGKNTKLLSYPYGSFEACSGIAEQVKEAGFAFAFTMERAANLDTTLDPLLLSRFDCNDLPLGKNDIFGNNSVFNNPSKREWHLHENSSVNQQ